MTPPAQLFDVPLRIEYASTTLPAASNLMAPTPPGVASLFDVYTHPSKLVGVTIGNTPPPSGSSCHV